MIYMHPDKYDSVDCMRIENYEDSFLFSKYSRSKSPDGGGDCSGGRSGGRGLSFHQIMLKFLIVFLAFLL